MKEAREPEQEHASAKIIKIYPDTSRSAEMCPEGRPDRPAVGPTCKHDTAPSYFRRKAFTFRPDASHACSAMLMPHVIARIALVHCWNLTMLGRGGWRPPGVLGAATSSLSAGCRFRLADFFFMPAGAISRNCAPSATRSGAPAQPHELLGIFALDLAMLCTSMFAFVSTSIKRRSCGSGRI